MSKAQTATEYLVILAVVIVIALIVVGVLGGIPSIGGGASANAVKAQLANYGPLKIDNWAVFRNETKVIIQNIYPDSIKLNSFTLNGTETVLNKQLRAGQRYEFSVDVAMLNPDKYSFPISFNWTDTQTSATYTTNETSAILTGTSVNSPYLIYARHAGPDTPPISVNGVSVTTSTPVVVDFLDLGDSFSYTFTHANQCVDSDSSISGSCSSKSITSCDGTSPATFGCSNVQGDITLNIFIEN